VSKILTHSKLLLLASDCQIDRNISNDNRKMYTLTFATSITKTDGLFLFTNQH